MTGNDLNHRENGVRKLGEAPGASDDREARESSPQIDATRQDAAREAGRLGGSDTFLVDQDMEDADQREAPDGSDGRPSPLANADNAER